MTPLLQTEQEGFKQASIMLRPKKWSVEVEDNVKQDFKSRSIEILCKGLSEKESSSRRKELDAYEVHFIIPTKFGGEVANNMVLVEPTLHKIVHDQIEAQTKGMKVCEERTIMLPHRSGIVWELNRS